MKRIVSLLTVLVLTCTMFSTPAFAYRHTETTLIDLGNGLTAEQTITVYDQDFRASTKRASATMEYKNNGEKIGTVTLTATFGYGGSDAWVVSASGSHTLEPGWSYSGERISDSGGTATLAATIKSTKGLGQFPVDISLTCSKNGDIS